MVKKETHMKVNKILKLITAIGESILGIPLLGGTIIVSLLWIPLVVMFILHIITLIYSSKENTSKAGSILGIITSVLGWIPILGMFMHIITAILLWIGFLKKD